LKARFIAQVFCYGVLLVAETITGDFFFSSAVFEGVEISSFLTGRVIHV